MSKFDTSSRSSLSGTIFRLGRFLRTKINHEMHGWNSMSDEFSDGSKKGFSDHRSHNASWKSELRNEYKKFRREYKSGEIDKSISQAINTVSHSLDQLFSSGAKALDTLFQDGNHSHSAESQRARMETQLQQQHYMRIEKLERSIAKSQKRLAWQGSFSVFFMMMSIAKSEGFFAAISIMLMFFTGFQVMRVRRQKHELERALANPAFANIHAPIDTDIEKKILRHAHSNRGIVFPELMAVQSDVALSDIERVIMQCLHRQLCTIEIDDLGRRYYYFAGLDFSA
jgi:ribosomal protein S20